MNIFELNVLASPVGGLVGGLTAAKGMAAPSMALASIGLGIGVGLYFGIIGLGLLVAGVDKAHDAKSLDRAGSIMLVVAEWSRPQCPACREHLARIAALEAKVAELEARLHDLCKPPTPPRPPEALPKGPAKQPTGKKPGGQPGHPPHLKERVLPERVNRMVTFVPAVCDHCQTPLPPKAGPDDPLPVRHQVAELPELAAHITEYQGQARTCPCCGKVTRASIPEDIRSQSVGPRLTAVLS